MEQEKKLQIIERIENEITKIETNDFKVYFFVLDTKGNPSGGVAYIYDVAHTLKTKGYNVTMLHQEKEFVGVGEWLGEKYSSLPHANIETDNVDVATSDILVIPEVFFNVMVQTKKLPCKRVILYQNFNYLAEFVNISATLADTNIGDIITTTKGQSDIIGECFPYMQRHIISPVIPNYFREGVEPKQLIVNIVTKDPSDIYKIVKPFYWKHPVYKWVSFRDIRGYSREAFADALREAAITIWVDNDSNFGYTPLEAIKSGSLVIARMPENLTDWMVDENNNLTDSVFWFDNIVKCHSLIASVVHSWMEDEIPETVYEAQNEVKKLYSPEQHEQEVEEVFTKIIKERKNELISLKNGVNKTE
jgi:hypothetical protein